ncbi:MAG: NADH-cytochrome b5 [Candidatus Peregrinibacteria bacterium GW2011_GWF2_33_10]|nr:MAG: NADH-cytochrome b5 [Candidatus Peregrinibacteria bacterium GW2011_GWF2_33_10]OGJ44636.1 MAG: hypothetical protein A2263_00120 [Candidatus Peregrinibacteria bacterium RIFOXYA2_FULL_33_21]OGJ46418.1 MAG: hypothetical protein A2272_06625 [Candidatus Peregrinibacteria bacterium RIFOXYA12_FULL_33_12]OGJ50271.1 MAG: hypothetical protein A2307_01765 [Candidatus Peregrinibacteria bacterium RIFOXYB2_FULL_33_20]
MKKITLIILVFFMGLTVLIYIFGFAFHAQSANQNIINQTPTSFLTKKEIARHSTENDCYLIVNDKVYDVTSYINKHPGGKNNIIKYCGQESSKIFAAIHSNFAWNLLNQFYVADLKKNF